MWVLCSKLGKCIFNSPLHSQLYSSLESSYLCLLHSSVYCSMNLVIYHVCLPAVPGTFACHLHSMAGVFVKWTSEHITCCMCTIWWCLVLACTPNTISCNGNAVGPLLSSTSRLLSYLPNSCPAFRSAGGYLSSEEVLSPWDHFSLSIPSVPHIPIFSLTILLH